MRYLLPSFVLLLCVGSLGADVRERLLHELHAKGQRGRGVKVAILDTGFRGYREHFHKNVLAKSFREDGNLEAKESNHGLLCAEIVRTVAPDAELLFANWEPEQPQAFLKALRWAKEQGATVISCSVTMPGWNDSSGTGSYSDEIKKILGTGSEPTDVVFVAAAGNFAQRHWAGSLSGTEQWHEWQPGERNQRLCAGLGESLVVEFRASPANTLRPRLFDERNVEITDVNYLPNPAGGISLRYTPTPGATYFLRVERTKPSQATFSLFVLGANCQYATPMGSIPFPANVPGVWAVGARDKKGACEEYSGRGQTNAKPEFFATVPFPTRLRREPFSGTSASAPQLAGLCVLLRAEYPKSTPEKLFKLLNGGR